MMHFIARHFIITNLVSKKKSSSNFTKEILGSHKTLDFSSSKIIFKKTLGAYKTFSSFYLGTSSYSKSKIKATKNLNYSFEIRPKTTASVYSFSSTTTRSISLISTILGSGDKFNVVFNAAVWFFTVAQLLFLSLLKILHRPFDKGKQNSCMPSC